MIWPTSVIVTSCHNAFQSQTIPAVLARILTLLDQSEKPSAGILYVLCLLLQRFDGDPPSQIPKILRLSWDSGLYHLRLEALELVASYAYRITDSVKYQIIDALSSMQTNNIFLNTQLVETSIRYGLFEPAANDESAVKEIYGIIRSEDSAEIREWAYIVITKQFEEIFGNAYFSAIAELSQEDEITLYTLGALGAPSYGWSIDFILERLLQLNTLRALPAFEYWAVQIDTQSNHLQHTARVFALAQTGLALFKSVPARLANLDSEAKLAWQLYGEILFWGNKLTVSHEEVLAKCAPLWNKLKQDLPFEAIDPLMHLWDTGKSRDIELPIKVLRDIAADFSETIVSLLEFGLANRAKLVTIFERSASFQEKYRTLFIIKILGQVGTSRSIKLLEPLTEDLDYGQEAIEGIHLIRKRFE
jgi:hypothetical protein